MRYLHVEYDKNSKWDKEEVQSACRGNDTESSYKSIRHCWEVAPCNIEAEILLTGMVTCNR